MLMLLFCLFVTAWAAPEDNLVEHRVWAGHTWLFQAGDDPGWAVYGYDDSHWNAVDANTPWQKMEPAPEGQINWYRTTVSGLRRDHKQALLIENIRFAAEVWVDGFKIAESGDVNRRKPGHAWSVFAPVPPELIVDGELQIAVRVWGDVYPGRDGQLGRLAVGSTALIQGMNDNFALSRWRHSQGTPMLFVGLFTIGLGFLHLMLYARRRKPSEGAFAVAALAYGMFNAFNAALAMGLVPTGAYFFGPDFGLKAVGMGGLLIFGHHFFAWPYRWITIGVVGLLAIAASMVVVGLPNGPLLIAQGLVSFLALAMLAVGIWKRVPGAVFFVVALPLVIDGIGDLLHTWIVSLPRGYRAWDPELDVLGQFTFMVAVSLALTQRHSNSLDELDETYRASYRFVPVPFLNLLGRKTITDVQRGDNTSLEMTVMFCDIRGFTTLSEARTAERNFKFINLFLEAMEPCIHGNGGFVGQYLGDGFLALFPAGTSSPVTAAVQMQDALADFNRAQVEAGEKAIKVGIGLHSGRVMLGTIGGADRLDTGVVSDVVNTASRVEGLTKMYGSPLVISAATRALASEEGWTTRELDAVVVKGRKSALEVYEVLEGEPDLHQRELKLAQQEVYAEALSAFRSGDMDRARELFVSLGDQAANALFIERCDWFGERGVPEDWDGVVRLTVK